MKRIVLTIFALALLATVSGCVFDLGCTERRDHDRDHDHHPFRGVAPGEPIPAPSRN